MAGSFDSIANLLAGFDMEILFVDFDGVLNAAVGPPQAMKRFVWGPVLDELLQPFPKTRLVIHASARDHTDVRTLIRQLGHLGRRVVDVAPKVIPRWQAICAWLSRHPDVPNYRILDDAPAEFPFGLSEVIVCDSRTGISALNIQKQLVEWLEYAGKKL